MTVERRKETEEKESFLSYSPVWNLLFVPCLPPWLFVLCYWKAYVNVFLPSCLPPSLLPVLFFFFPSSLFLPLCLTSFPPFLPHIPHFCLLCSSKILMLLMCHYCIPIHSFKILLVFVLFCVSNFLISNVTHKKYYLFFILTQHRWISFCPSGSI